MPKLKYKGVEYNISDQELTEIKNNSKKRIEIKEGLEEVAINVLVTI